MMSSHVMLKHFENDLPDERTESDQGIPCLLF